MILSRADWPAMRGKLESLFKASFGREIHDGYLDWRYLDNGQDNILISVDVTGDNVVSSYSAFPVSLICDGVSYNAATSMTTMTHPEWQGKGAIVKLGKELYAHAESQGFACVWGFPNSRIHTLRNAMLGWSDIYEVPTMVLNLSSVDLRRLVLDGTVQRDDEFVLRYPPPLNDGLIRVKRTREYLVWRYARNPINSYKTFVLSRGDSVSSYVVIKAYMNGIDLVDIQQATPQEGRIILSHILKWCIDQGIHRVSCWAPTHHSLHAVLERFGFENAAPITYFGGRELAASVLPKDWLLYRKWFLQMGDSDVY